MDGFLVILGAIIIIILLWITIAVHHLKNLQKGIEEEWWVLYEMLTKKSDLIPNIIETVRMYDKSKEEQIKPLIEVRAKYNKEYFPLPQKIEYELDLNKLLKDFIEDAGKGREIATDTNFLEIKKEIYDVSENIEEKTNLFNKMVRYYNDHRDFPLIRPVAKLFKYNRLNIFETEF
ncbi:MAG: LemA family protein [Candidatus Gracilibacteria bacterium]|jgi:LemA protein